MSWPKKILKSSFLTSNFSDSSFHLFSKDLITFIISFISLFVGVTPKPLIDEIPFLIFLPIILSPTSARISSFKFWVLMFFNSFKYGYRALNGKLTKLSKSVISVKNSPACIILDNRVFENFILVDEPFAKALQMFETCVSVNNVLCGKSVSSLEFLIKFDKRFKVTSVPFLFSNFNLLSCELDHFTFKCYIESFYIKTKWNHNTLTVPFKKSKICLLVLQKWKTFPHLLV